MIFSSREGFCLLTPKVWGSPQSNCNALRGLASPTSGSPLFLGCKELRDIHQAYPCPLFLEGLIPNCGLQLWQSHRRVATPEASSSSLHLCHGPVFSRSCQPSDAFRFHKHSGQPVYLLFSGWSLQMTCPHLPGKKSC